MGFGQGPLSQPLLVEVLEDEFVPVLVYNNQAGRDAELLAKYDEPAWNNPVLRFLDVRGVDVLPRKDGVWSTAAVAARLVEALAAAKRPAPAYLKNLASELGAKRQRALFTMYCFWEGEAAFGALEGVLSTSAVFAGAAGQPEQEGVDLTYDPSIVSYEQLLATWQTLQCANTAFTFDREQLATARAKVGEKVGEKAQPAPARVTPTPPADRKHALRLDPGLWKLPMTPLQQARVNAALTRNGDPLAALSPRQRLLARRLGDATDSANGKLAALEPPEELAGFQAYAEKVFALLRSGHSSQRLP